jgi:acetyl esterase/lipase
MKKVLTLFLWMFLSSVLVFSQPEDFLLYPDGNIPLNKNCSSIPKIDSTKEGRPSRLKNIQIPKMTYWKTFKPRPKKTALLVIPGGSYAFVSYENEGRKVAERFQNEGFDVFVLKYRLPNPDCQKSAPWVPLTDAMTALELIQKLGYEKVGVTGFSAGGHLASNLATLFNNNPFKTAVKPPNFACLVYPVISFKESVHVDSKRNLLGKDTSQSMVDLFSSELQISKDTPPTLLIHSADDQSVSYQNSEIFFENLLKKKVHSEIHLFPFGGHGFGLGRVERAEAPEWVHLALDFFERF